MTETFLEQFVSLGVRVNDIIVPGRLIEATLGRHAFSLVVNNDDDVFKVSLVGSATAVLFAGRYILLCTSHQLQGVDPQRVSMLKDDGSILVTSSGFRAYAPNADTDAYDIAAFDFSDAVEAHPDLKPRFFRFEDVPPDTANVNVLAMLLSGFPSVEQNYDLGENNHIGLARRQVVCLPYRQPSDNALLTVEAQTHLPGDPDGMSGGSAFVVQLDKGEPAAYFAGLIARGGKQFFHIIKAGFIAAFLRSVFDDRLEGALHDGKAF